MIVSVGLDKNLQAGEGHPIAGGLHPDTGIHYRSGEDLAYLGI